MPSLLRSFFAVILGFVVMMLAVIVLTLVFVKTMGVRSGHPTPAYLAVNVAYSLLAATIGGAVTALVAGVKPMQHAGVLAGVMLLMGVLSYHGYRGGQPGWYQAMRSVVPPLCALGGAWLVATRSRAGGFSSR